MVWLLQIGRGAILFLISQILFLIGCSKPVSDPLSEPNSPEYVERGKDLVQGLAACGFCHGAKNDPNAPLSGGQLVYDDQGAMLSANITPARSGIWGYSASELMRVFRLAEGKDERKLRWYFHSGYEWLSDRDLLSIISYIKAQPAVENQIKQQTSGNFKFNPKNALKIFSRSSVVGGVVPSIRSTHALEYGRYLVTHVARCSFCHNSPSSFFSDEGFLKGGKSFRRGDLIKTAPALTAEKFKLWSEEQIVDYLVTGLTPDLRGISPDFCPTRFYRNAEVSDLFAIARFVKTQR
ncbi:MAG TPA: hypothetical protein PKD37_01415 [Oligoflexia bacterium]|nr:hypothetical protein [Oligoflexia bacterium]HMP26635.1 hypothetical protein [Oligoflexia bacterium]